MYGYQNQDHIYARTDWFDIMLMITPKEIKVRTMNLKPIFSINRLGQSWNSTFHEEFLSL